MAEEEVTLLLNGTEKNFGKEINLNKKNFHQIQKNNYFLVKNLLNQKFGLFHLNFYEKLFL